MKTSAILILVGFYYGFFTIFSIGPSFFFLIFILRYRVMEEGKEKEVSATTGFIAGQILNVISIYYTPLYKILVRPHLITILVIPYIYFIIFYFNNKNDYYYIKSTSIHNLIIQFIFFNNLIYQLLNNFILPSSALTRLVNIYMFKYNNKILFLTSSFCGWLISHILFIKSISSIVFWIRHNYYHIYKHNKYIITEFKNNINRIFSIFLFFILLSYLGRMPSPFFTRKFLDIEKVKIIEDEYSFEIDYEIKKRYNYIQVYKDYNLEINNRLKEDKMKINFWFENIFVNFLFDYKRWNRPLRYIKNIQFDKFLRNEMSQFLFFTCTNDGNKRISFTYPYSLSIFLENIDKKLFNEYILNSCINTNEKRMFKLNDEFKKRIKKIEINNNTEKDNIFEKRILLCDDKKQIKYLPNLYDPFFNGPNRININNMDTNSLSGIFLINNIYNILNINNYYGILGYSENTIKYFQFLFDVILSYEKKINNKYFIIRLNKIKKYIPIWSYKLKERLEEEEEDNEEEFEEEDIFDINSRKFKHIIIYKENNKDTNNILISNNTDKKDINEERIDEVTLIHYSNKSDFSRNLIKGSMRAQRRKIVIWDLFQVNAHSPLFLDRLTNSFSLINDLIFNKFIDIKTVKELHLKIPKLEKEHKYKDDQIEINKDWDNPLFNQVIRSLMLVIQSYFRKYILLPLLIIVKNILRVLLFQIPEWELDFKEWSKEMHIKCTYNGVQLSETEFPEDWLIDGIQIKILYPFCIKPFIRDKSISHNIKRPKSFFLTIWGGETEHLFGDPRKQSFIFNPIYKEIKKRVNIFFFKFKGLKKKNKNNIFYESYVLSQTTNISNICLFQTNIRDVYYKVFKIRKQTEQILKEKNNIIQYYKDGVLQSYMYFWIILVKNNIRLTRKSYYFIQLFFEKLYKLYIIFLLYIITFYKIKVKLFFYSSKYYFMKFNTYIYKEQDIFYEITKNTINFILIIKKIFLNTKNIKKIKNTYFLSYFSQAYVFYKLSQYQKLIFIFIYKLRRDKYNEINTDIKNDWKMWFDLFFKSKIEENDILINYEWYNKNNKYYEYNLNQNKIVIQIDKEYLIKDYYKLYSLVKKKRDKWTKNHRYDILLNKYLFNDISTLMVKIKNKRGYQQDIEYDFNKQKYKSFFIYYLNRYIPYTTKKKNRDNNLNINNILYKKYLDYRIINSHLINYRNKIIIDIFNFKYWFFTELFIYFDVYKEKPWFIPIKSLLFNIYKRSDLMGINKKKRINSNELSEKIIIYKDFIRLESKNIMEKEQYTNNREAELYYFLKNSLLFQLRWSDALNKRIIKNIKVYCLLLRLKNPKDIYISSIQRSEIKVDDMLIQKDLSDFINNGIFIFEPIIIHIRRGVEHIIYQTLDISLNKKYIRNNKYKNKSNIFFPENILSLKRRREFRFIICLNYLNISNNNKKIYNGKKILLNSSKYLQANKSFIHLKMFLWPNFRVEDISCINRYCFNINNGSCFSILKLYMYSKYLNK
uniref:Protein TIC 214 n=1 Tax=Gastrodia crispa TaxID=2974001 RepID=A0A976UG26_9ASPA|nr:hypothetical protein RF1 [Gastrodia crispa]UVG40882.1 hypothetical protein RF1 [Gastrodia crispa]